MNDENLIKNSDLTPTQRKEKARKAGIASGKVRHFKANIKDALLERLGDDATMDAFVGAVMEAAIAEHNSAAWTFVRDTIGQKPVEKQEVTASVITNEQRDAALRAYYLMLKDKHEEEA